MDVDERWLELKRRAMDPEDLMAQRMLREYEKRIRVDDTEHLLVNGRRGVRIQILRTENRARVIAHGVGMNKMEHVTVEQARSLWTYLRKETFVSVTPAEFQDLKRILTNQFKINRFGVDDMAWFLGLIHLVRHPE